MFNVKNQLIRSRCSAYLTALLKVEGKAVIQVSLFFLHTKHAVLIQLSSLGS